MNVTERAESLAIVRARAEGYADGMRAGMVNMEGRLNEAHNQGYERGRESANDFPSLLLGLVVGSAAGATALYCFM